MTQAYAPHQRTSATIPGPAIAGNTSTSNKSKSSLAISFAPYMASGPFGAKVPSNLQKVRRPLSFEVENVFTINN